MRFIAAALAAMVALATPVSAATLQEKQEFTTQYLNKHLTPEEPWAHRDRLRVTDGFAFRPALLREVQVRFVVAHGYVKPPKPPVASSSTPATTSVGIGAGAGYSADWLAIAACETGGGVVANIDWAENEGTIFDGGLQFHPDTWLGFGGAEFAPEAWQASPSEQIIVGERVLAGQGPGAWPNCFHYL